MNKSKFNILIACEESQTFCKCWRDLGYNAFSCDLQPCSGNHLEWHIMGDCFDLLDKVKNIVFVTCDGKKHFINKWHLVIAHPPCTFLSAAGACHLYDSEHKIKDFDRLNKLYKARDFFMRFYNLDVPYLVIENPRPLSVAKLPKRSCVLQPYEFGEKYSKATWLWLRRLSVPFPTMYYPKEKCKIFTDSCSGSVKRSKTFPLLAAACVNYWNLDILEDYEKGRFQL